MEGEYLTIETAKKLVNQEKQIELLSKKIQYLEQLNDVQTDTIERLTSIINEIIRHTKTWKYKFKRKYFEIEWFCKLLNIEEEQ